MKKKISILLLLLSLLYISPVLASTTNSLVTITKENIIFQNKEEESIIFNKITGYKDLCYEESTGMIFFINDTTNEVTPYITRNHEDGTIMFNFYDNGTISQATVSPDHSNDTFIFIIIIAIGLLTLLLMIPACCL